jgi:hypothetical protein
MIQSQTLNLKSKHRLYGLLNRHLSCWGNATIELLVHIEPLVQLIKELPVIRNEMHQWLKSKIDDMERGPTDIVSITAIKIKQHGKADKLLMKDANLDKIPMQDANELLKKILTLLCENDNTESEAYKTNPFKDLFTFDMLEYNRKFSLFVFKLKRKFVPLYRKHNLMSIIDLEKFKQCLDPIKIVNIMIKVNFWESPEQLE